MDRMERLCDLLLSQRWDSGQQKRLAELRNRQCFLVGGESLGFSGRDCENDCGSEEGNGSGGYDE